MTTHIKHSILTDLIIAIDHIGICIEKIDPTAVLWSELLGLPITDRECVDVQKTEAVFLDLPQGPTAVELVAPMAGNEGLHKFLNKRGQGLHHLAFAVRDISVALMRLQDAGVPLIDCEPRPGARGHWVAFLHPKATAGTLVELVERRISPSSTMRGLG